MVLNSCTVTLLLISDMPSLRWQPLRTPHLVWSFTGITLFFEVWLSFRLPHVLMQLKLVILSTLCTSEIAFAQNMLWPMLSVSTILFLVIYSERFGNGRLRMLFIYSNSMVTLTTCSFGIPLVLTPTHHPLYNCSHLLLCRYLNDSALRCQIHQSCTVVGAGNAVVPPLTVFKLGQSAWSC